MWNLGLPRDYPGPHLIAVAHAGRLTRVEGKRVIQPEDQRWLLPCGAGAVTVHHEWQQPPRIVLRLDDDRGIYLQKAPAA